MLLLYYRKVDMISQPIISQKSPFVTLLLIFWRKNKKAPWTNFLWASRQWGAILSYISKFEGKKVLGYTGLSNLLIYYKK